MMQPPENVAAAVQAAVFHLFDAVSLLGTLFGLALSAIAIWISWAFKREADAVNAETMRLLTEIKSESRMISQGVMAELRAHGESMRGTFDRNSMVAPTVAETKPLDLHLDLRDSDRYRASEQAIQDLVHDKKDPEKQ